ncbi:transposable element Tcb2 transposase [Trichonephila clavipes]|nr:transposable element Tcb2 transposase [Trichonephila clavipes]
MGLSQADAARRLNVSRSVVHSLCNQYQTEASVSIRRVPGRPRATTPTRDHFIALSARRRISVSQLATDPCRSVRIISASTVRRGLHDSGLCARRPVVLVQIHTGERKDVSSSGGTKHRYRQSNTVERHGYRADGITVWAGISLGGHTDLHVFQGGALTDVRYLDEILDPYVHPYTDAIGNDFILMDDNARPHRAVIAEVYFEGLSLERIKLVNYYECASEHNFTQVDLCSWPLVLNRSEALVQDLCANQSVLRTNTLVALHFKYDQARRRFVEWAQTEIAVVPDFHKRILFSDEAHFWLNGCVNKQNCRIWSEANPQLHVETPLHQEKLTVWCALWAGGIIGSYFFKNDECHNVTVNGVR